MGRSEGLCLYTVVYLKSLLNQEKSGAEGAARGVNTKAARSVSKANGQACIRERATCEFGWPDGAGPRSFGT
jgi:hypothetical protein